VQPLVVQLLAAEFNQQHETKQARLKQGKQVCKFWKFSEATVQTEFTTA
jgi:hypothetical protein